MLRRCSKGVVLCCCCCFATLAIGGCKQKAPPPTRPPDRERASVSSSVKKPPTSSAVRPANRGIDASGKMQIGDNDRCPVCAMKVAGKKLASAIVLSSGETYYFCGTGCLIKSWLHPEIFLGHGKKQLSRAVTTEYFSGKHIDALTARWVAGSDVVGPMGPALVPLADDAALKDFKRRHGGKVVFSLRELNDARWKQITGKDATMRSRR